ncbi:MAG: VIT and VWA domain-containing protein [Gammaproteobacteria bacterium]
MLRILLLCILVYLPVAQAQNSAPPKNPENPLGGVLQARMNGETILLPHLKTDIEADIQGDLATVTVRQTFLNPADTPLNATYLFPLNQDAAVYEMIMEVGEERLRAEIQRIEEARATFKKAQREGRSAALLSQHRPNMFSQDVANLMPGLPIIVTLRYVQPVPKIDADYELVIPLVVGPRYQPQGAGEPALSQQATDDALHPVALNDTDAADTGRTVGGGVPRWQMDNPPALAGGADRSESQTAFGRWELQQLPAYPPVAGLELPAEIAAERVGLTIRLQAGLPIQQAISPTHVLQQEQRSEQYWQFRLASGRTLANRDFILRYRLAGQTTQAGLLSYWDEQQQQGYFSVLLEPPAQPAASQINPREVVFVLDCSGSMAGLPMAASKNLARTMLERLRADDYFRIIRFSDRATEFSSQPLPATAANIQQGQRYLDTLQGSGGTEMSSGIRQALGAPLAPDTLRLVVFLTDGYIGNEFDILRLIDQQLGNARLYSFGVGAGVNRFLLTEMARVGRGFVRIMDPTSEKLHTVVEELAGRLQTPVLTDISIDWGELNPLEVTPDPLPDLFAGESLRIMGRYQQSGSYVITVHGKVAGQSAALPLQIALPQPSGHELVADDNASDDNTSAGRTLAGRTLAGRTLALSWARSRIKHAMHQLSTPRQLRPEGLSDTALKQTITRLGLEHALVTQWTAFVAVSERIYNPNPQITTDLAGAFIASRRGQ